MNESHATDQELSGMSREELMSELFAHLVMQQSNMAMMLLGKVPHPQTGEPVRDMEAAKLFIDQLEMLEVKTRGNLSKAEEQFLKQSLMTLRLAFVEAVESPEAKSAPADAARETAPAATPENPPPAAEPDDKTDRKKFSKKY